MQYWSPLISTKHFASGIRDTPSSISNKKNILHVYQMFHQTTKFKIHFLHQKVHKCSCGLHRQDLGWTPRTGSLLAQIVLPPCQPVCKHTSLGIVLRLLDVSYWSFEHQRLYVAFCSTTNEYLSIANVVQLSMPQSWYGEGDLRPKPDMDPGIRW